MSIDKQELKDVISLATEIHAVDSNKFSEIKGILQGVLLFSKKEKYTKIKVKEQSA